MRSYVTECSSPAAAAAHAFFKDPDVHHGEQLPQLKWTAPDEEGLVDFLVREKNFNEDRIRSAVKKINAAKGKANQGRLESFFGPVVTKPSASKAKAVEAKGKKGAGKGALGAKGGVSKKAPIGAGKKK